MYYKIIPMLFLFVLYFCQPIYGYDGAPTVTTISELQMDIVLLQQEVEAVGDTSKEILATLRGRGGDTGLVTKVAVNDNKIGGLQGWMLIISVMLLGLFGYGIKSRIGKK